MNKLLLSGVALFIALNAGVARADTVVCPSDMTGVIQLGACPSEEDLRLTFRGYCSDNQRMYDQGRQLCLDYETYRSAKNVSLWETADGKFDGYLSCDQSAQQRAEMRPNSIKVNIQGSVTRVVCSYREDAVLTHRTKAKCVVDQGTCATDPNACKAICE